MTKLKSMIMAATMLLPLTTMAYETIRTEKLHVWYELPVIVADGQTVNYLKVYEHDDDDSNFTAFNMYFILPEGFSIHQVKSGRGTKNDITLSERFDESHSIGCNMAAPTQLKVACTSNANDIFYNTDLDGQPMDLIYTIGLIADPSLATGDYQVYMEDIKFVFPNADARQPQEEPVYYNMKVEGNGPITAIEQVESDELDPDDCYDLHGLRIDPAKAHGMIVVSKGRKLYVK